MDKDHDPVIIIDLSHEEDELMDNQQELEHGLAPVSEWVSQLCEEMVAPIKGLPTAEIPRSPIKPEVRVEPNRQVLERYMAYRARANAAARRLRAQRKTALQK